MTKTTNTTKITKITKMAKKRKIAIGEDYEGDEVDECNEDKVGGLENPKKNLTLFMTFFPSVILAIIPFSINGSGVIAFGIKACVLLLQLVILKNFIETYYD